MEMALFVAIIWLFVWKDKSRISLCKLNWPAREGHLEGANR